MKTSGSLPSAGRAGEGGEVGTSLKCDVCTRFITPPLTLRDRRHLRSGDYGSPVLGAPSPSRGGERIESLVTLATYLTPA
jgi:hypothetical protein